MLPETDETPDAPRGKPVIDRLVVSLDLDTTAFHAKMDAALEKLARLRKESEDAFAQR
jgi:hypothetical protein